MNAAAIGHLRRGDPVLARVIARAAPCNLGPVPGRSPFEALVRAVAHQQLNGRAASTILKRFRALFGTGRFPGAAAVLAIAPERLRAAGFSRAKVEAIRDIATKTLEGRVPSSRAIAGMGDEEIIERLTECRGVGRWTVQMLLMFKLGRPDVLPSDDFGIRQGFRVTYGLPGLPRPGEILAFGERWRPYRSTASWYLWRAWEEVSSPAPGNG